MSGLTVDVHRQKNETDVPELQQYVVPYVKDMHVLDALNYIQANHDQTLSYRWNCREGICGSCSMEVNGKPVLTCKTKVEEGKPLRIEPMKVFPILKDLVVDISEVYEKATPLKTHFHAPNEKEFYKMHDREIKAAEEFRNCINCMLCYDVCHVIRNSPKKDAYLGPRNVVKAMSYEAHPKDQANRSFLLNQAGLKNCNVTRCCEEVCPQDIKITRNAIIPAKERLAHETSPVTRAVRRLRGK